MIDKYKPPRVQRIPGWRGFKHRPVREVLQEAQRRAGAYLATNDAMVSGAMPNEFDPRDLRAG